MSTILFAYTIKGEDKRQPVAIILDNVSFAENLGKIWRIADSARCEVIPCARTPRPPDPDVVHFARETAATVPQRYFFTAVDAIDTLREEGYTIWVAELAEFAGNYKWAPIPKKLALVVGNELKGVNMQTIVKADRVVFIPVPGEFKALNVATCACTIVFDVLGRAWWSNWDENTRREAAFWKREVIVNEQDAIAWINLGLFGGAEVEGTLFREKDCYRKAVAVDPTSNDARNRLAKLEAEEGSAAMRATETVDDRVALNPGRAEARDHLDSNGGDAVHGQEPSGAECYQSALARDPADSKAWYNLGASGGGAVHGSYYKAKDCFQMALSLDPTDSEAWTNLGSLGGGRIDGTRYSETDCYQKALAWDPTNDEAWLSLGCASPA